MKLSYSRGCALIMWFVMYALSVLGTYVATSVFFFKFPNLIHKKKTLRFRCHHISHRGGAGENLENTMQAFRHALKCGTDMLEIDCQITKDGQVVISHDDHLLRTTGVDAFISGLNYNELPPLKDEIFIDFDLGKTCRGGPDRKIPLLRDVFESFPDTVVNIDIKVDNNDLIKKTSDLIRTYRREHITVWGNFCDNVTRKCFIENPEVCLLFSTAAVMKLILLTYSGLLPFVPLRQSCLEVFLPSVYLRKVKAAAAVSSPLIDCVVWAMDKLLLRKSIIEHLDKRGIQTYVWVGNYEYEFEDAFKRGAHGVMTDYPSRLQQYLQQHPEFIHKYEHSLHGKTSNSVASIGIVGDMKMA